MVADRSPGDKHSIASSCVRATIVILTGAKDTSVLSERTFDEACPLTHAADHQAHDEATLSIVVVANRHRPAVVLDSLGGTRFQISYTPDYELPADFATNIQLAAYNQVGAYRCFRGHQDALSLADNEWTLVLEDDATPNVAAWGAVVESALASLPRPDAIDVLSLHARGFDPDRMTQRAVVGDRRVLVPRFWDGPVRVFGSLAYLIRRSAALRFRAMQYEGIPVDLLLPNRFRFALLHPSPFDHDRRYPSLVG